jgi:hypothetical protein
MAAQGILGETFNAGYRVRTPPYTDELRAGDAVDSGIVMILDQNLSHVSRELLHHLATAIVSGDALPQSVFADLEDLDTPANTASPVERLAWSRLDSVCWGPFDLTQDRVETTGDELRSVVMYVDCLAGGTGTLTLVGAITQGTGTPRDENLVTFTSVVPTTTRGRVEVALTPARVAFARRRARPSGSEYAAFTDLWLWLGWQSTSGGDRVIAVDVWETR